jgi:uncharacterized protein YuzE
MKNNKPKIAYDKESKVLSIIVKDEKSIDSDVQGNAVIDYNKEGDIVKINLYNFSFSNFKDKIKSIKEFTRESKIPVLVK